MTLHVLSVFWGHICLIAAAAPGDFFTCRASSFSLTLNTCGDKSFIAAGPEQSTIAFTTIRQLWTIQKEEEEDLLTL